MIAIIIPVVIIIFIASVVRRRKIIRDYEVTDSKSEQAEEKIDLAKPIQILKQRLAKGEISVKEYDEVKKEVE